MEFLDLFTPAAVAAEWAEAGSNKIPYLGEGLFPNKKKAGLDLSWIKGTNGIPVSLMPSTFDAQATFRDRIPLTRIDTEMPFFREGFKIKERDRQDILRAAESSDPYAEAAISRVFDDANALIQSAAVVRERMRMQLLFPVSGEVGIVIKANGVDYTYEYDAADVWKDTNYTALTSTAVWSAPSTADPFKNFSDANDAVVAATGSELRYAIMNSATFNLLPAMTAVKNRFLSTSGVAAGYITKADIIKLFQDATGITIIVYDKQYKNESGTTAKFVPNDYVSLIPEGALGSTYFGTTPEEADGRAAPMDVALVDTGVAVSRIVEPHPVNVNTIVSEITLPSYERMDEVAVIKVK